MYHIITVSTTDDTSAAVIAQSHQQVWQSSVSLDCVPTAWCLLQDVRHSCNALGRNWIYPTCTRETDPVCTNSSHSLAHWHITRPPAISVLHTTTAQTHFRVAEWTGHFNTSKFLWHIRSLSLHTCIFVSCSLTEYCITLYDFIWKKNYMLLAVIKCQLNGSLLHSARSVPWFCIFILFIYLFMMKSYKSTQKNTKKNKKANQQRIGLRHTQRFNNQINVRST